MTIKVRNNLKTGTVVQHDLATDCSRITGTVLANSVRSIGDYQLVDTIPNTGKYRPGKLKLNPVMMRKGNGTSTPGTAFLCGGSTVRSQSVYGDTAAYGFDPNVSPAWGTWNDMSADWTLCKAYAKLSKPDVDLGIFVGELNHTVAMFASPIKALRRFLNKKKRDAYDAERWLKLRDLRVPKRGANPSQLRLIQRMLDRAEEAKIWRKIQGKYTITQDLWLMYRFGIQPLLMDIDNACYWLNRILLKHSSYIHRKSSTFKSKTSSLEKTTGQAYNVFWDVHRYTTVDIRTTSVVYYRVRRDMSLMEQLGLETANLPSVAWELAKYSFVVDRFIGIQNWLNAKKATPWLQICGVSQSQKTETVVTCTTSNYRNTYGLKATSFESGNFAWRGSTLIRKIGGHLPAAPVLNPNSLKIIQQLDHIALLSQRIKFKRR